LLNYGIAGGTSRSGQKPMSFITNLLLTMAGIGLITFVFYDIYATILRSTKYPGLFSDILNRSLWRIANGFTKNLDRRRDTGFYRQSDRF